MKKYIFHLFFIFTLTFHLCCNNAKDNNIDIKLITNTSYRKLDTKYVKIVIMNKNDSSIFFPEWLRNGYKEDPETELYFTILKKNPINKKFEEITQRDIDYDFFEKGRLNMVIRPGGKYEIQTQMNGMYELEDTGYYKVQALIDIQTPFKFKKQSGWTEFYISDN
jgi:hypothetical protein